MRSLFDDEYAHYFARNELRILLHKKGLSYAMTKEGQNWLARDIALAIGVRDITCVVEPLPPRHGRANARLSVFYTPERIDEWDSITTSAY